MSMNNKNLVFHHSPQREYKKYKDGKETGEMCRIFLVAYSLLKIVVATTAIITTTNYIIKLFK